MIAQTTYPTLATVSADDVRNMPRDSVALRVLAAEAIGFSAIEKVGVSWVGKPDIELPACYIIPDPANDANDAAALLDWMNSTGVTVVVESNPINAMATVGGYGTALFSANADTWLHAVTIAAVLLAIRLRGDAAREALEENEQ